MKKAVAVPYIIAIVLGVIVIGLLGYWFINQAGKTTKTGSDAECNAKTFSFCLKWQSQDSSCEKNKPTVDAGCKDVSKTDCQNLNLCK